jgi:hypothetical protein
MTLVSTMLPSLVLLAAVAVGLVIVAFAVRKAPGRRSTGMTTEPARARDRRSVYPGPVLPPTDRRPADGGVHDRRDGEPARRRFSSATRTRREGGSRRTAA